MNRKKNGAGRPAVKDAPMVQRVDGLTWLQVQEAAGRLGVTRGRVYHLIAARRVRTRRFDGLIYVREQDVRLYHVVRREFQHALAGTG